MRLCRSLLIVSLALAAACSHGVPITQAQATCEKSGDDTDDVALYAWYEGTGWGPPHVADWRAPSSYRRFLVWADLGTATPLRGMTVRVEDDHNVFPNPPPTKLKHVTVTGRFVCKQRAGTLTPGYLVPTSIVVDK